MTPSPRLLFLDSSGKLKTFFYFPVAWICDSFVGLSLLVSKAANEPLRFPCANDCWLCTVCLPRKVVWTTGSTLYFMCSGTTITEFFFCIGGGKPTFLVASIWSLAIRSSFL